ncbi:hypothetical protein EYV94_27865 [Puteibacter caeruleilacunae]|nr:hypothetical protein EYV94_27865 [Puteibacter caeruleilacunae]
MKITQAIILITLSICFLCSCQTEVHRDYYSDGTLKEEYSMRNGKFIGKHRAYYEDGTLRTIGQHKNGRMSGTWHYYPDGSIQKLEKGKTVSANYWDFNGVHVVKNGTGLVKTYYPSGQIESIMSWKDNVYHGKCVTWSPEGVKTTKVFFEKGKPVGTWKYWNEHGELIKTQEY